MPACRLIGGNAGRMVKRMPLRLATDTAGSAAGRRTAGTPIHPQSRVHGVPAGGPMVGVRWWTTGPDAAGSGCRRTGGDHRTGLISERRHMTSQALGLIETVGLPAAVEAADAAMKAANVQLIGYEKTRGGGLVTVKIRGDVGAVQAAVASAVAAASKVGRVYSHHVIPRPHDQTELVINRWMPGRRREMTPRRPRPARCARAGCGAAPRRRWKPLPPRLPGSCRGRGDIESSLGRNGAGSRGRRALRSGRGRGDAGGGCGGSGAARPRPF